jgi:6-pyruvoyltetrahydropterin/6-carboxytetrahydropterin synthase
VFLPISNTTAELMAMFIGDELIRNFLSPGGFTWENMTLGVDENEGQWAYCRFENSP